MGAGEAHTPGLGARQVMLPLSCHLLLSPLQQRWCVCNTPSVTLRFLLLYLLSFSLQSGKKNMQHFAYPRIGQPKSHHHMTVTWRPTLPTTHSPAGREAPPQPCFKRKNATTKMHLAMKQTTWPSPQLLQMTRFTRVQPLTAVSEGLPHP